MTKTKCLLVIIRFLRPTITGHFNRIRYFDSFYVTICVTLEVRVRARCKQYVCLLCYVSFFRLCTAAPSPLTKSGRFCLREFGQLYAKFFRHWFSCFPDILYKEPRRNNAGCVIANLGRSSSFPLPFSFTYFPQNHTLKEFSPLFIRLHTLISGVCLSPVLMTWIFFVAWSFRYLH